MVLVGLVLVGSLGVALVVLVVLVWGRVGFLLFRVGCRVFRCRRSVRREQWGVNLFQRRRPRRLGGVVCRCLLVV